MPAPWFASSSRAPRIARALIVTNLTMASGFAFVAVRNFFSPEALVGSDFTVFWTAWTLILHGPSSALYSEAAQRATQQSLMRGGQFEGGLMAFLNPPHAA